MNGIRELSLKPVKVVKEFTLLGKAGLVVILLIFLVSVFAPWLSIHPHDVSSGPPLSPPGEGHLLGTDELGIDLWVQICCPQY